MLWLYVQAPFAAFRTFTAGWYRPTAEFLTPSAAYGLVLNVAGIETRRDDGLSPMTVTRFELPPVRIALGAVPGPQGIFPSVQTVFQQLHNYPVGASGKERKEDAKGNKYNITPVRREFLADLRACIGLDFFENPEIEDKIRLALSKPSPSDEARYGLPFLGDNAFLIDKLQVLNGPMEAHWYRRLGPDNDVGFVPHTTRLTIWIDRLDMSKTQSELFAPIDQASEAVSDDTWTVIRPPQEPPASKPTTKRKGKT